MLAIKEPAHYEN